MKVLKYIPNTLTTMNLISGCAGLIFVVHGDVYFAAIAVLFGALFDFLDGFAARLFRVSSALGKQLDSLADMVTFGVLPAFLMFSLLQNIGWNYLPYLSILIVVASAYRLAGFNIDESQKMVFKGLPTPAAAFLVIGLVFAWLEDWEVFSFLSETGTGLILFVLILSYLLNAPVPFLSLKLTSFRIRENAYLFIIVVVFLICIIIFGLKGILPGMLFYVVLSLLSSMIGRTALSSE